MDTQDRRENNPDEEAGRKTIRNRDVMVLSHVLYTIQDLRIAEQMRDWQQDRLYSMTQRITGMPCGGNPQDIGDKIAAVGELEKKYSKQCTEYLRALKNIEIILNKINDGKLRTFVVMRYVFQMENTKIMTELNMKRRKFEQMCKAVEQAPDMEHVVWRA